MTAVLHVITGLGLGGAERMLTKLAVELHNAGMPQHVVSLRGRGPYAADLDTAAVPVTTFDIKSPGRACSALWELRKLVQRLRPDVIQGWLYHGDLMATVAHRLSPGAARRRLFWNIRASNMDATRYGRVVRAGALLSRWPDVVISNSEAGARFHSAHGYCPRRCVVIPNGVDVQQFRPDPEVRRRVRAELGLGAGVVAIHVARVDPMKDHQTCIAALAKTPSVTGILVGAGTEHLAVPANVRALGARREMEQLYAAADLVVSSSAFGEGFSNALAEGMSAGLVPIATDVGDSATVIGDTGRVVAAGDPCALAEAIRAEAGFSPEQRRSRGLLARSRIVERFSLARMVRAYAQLYQEAASSAARNL